MKYLAIVSKIVEFRMDYLYFSLAFTENNSINEIIYYFVEQVLIEFPQWANT